MEYSITSLARLAGVSTRTLTVVRRHGAFEAVSAPVKTATAATAPRR